MFLADVDGADCGDGDVVIVENAVHVVDRMSKVLMIGMTVIAINFRIAAWKVFCQSNKDFVE